MGLAGGLLVAEILIRLVAPMPVKADSGQFFQPHPLYGWTHIPNQHGPWAGIGSLPREFKTEIQINSHGLRDREIPYEKPKGVSRILLLGDSMTEGLQVALEETFAKRMERVLNAAGKSVEVINAGIGEYGTDNELLFYRHEGRKYHPDVVLLAFFLNDVLDNFPPLETANGRPAKPYFTLMPKGLVLQNFPMRTTLTSPALARRGDWLEPVKGFLRQRSEFYSWGTTVLLRHPWTMRALGLLGLAQAETVAQAEAAARTWTDDPPYYLPFRVPEDPRITRVGKFIRKYSIDEVPQLINILRGEMSLVGPRPEMPFIVEQYQRWERVRLNAKPGLTGLWQILGRKDVPLRDNLQYDFYYVFNQSFFLDLAIVLRTVPRLLLPRGAY